MMLCGFYNNNSKTQASLIQHCSDLLQRAGAEVRLPADRPLLVAEWGCSHGGNSGTPVMLLCNQLQQRLTSADTSQPLQVHVVHSDVIDNDWSALFTCAQQYVQQVHQQHPQLQLTYAGLGRSMYENNHPSCSIDLGFSFSTLHWQAKKVLIPERAIYPLKGLLLPQEFSVLQQHAVSNLRLFLELRAKEFRPGGMLVLAYPSTLCGPDNEPLRLRYHVRQQEVADALVLSGVLKPHELGFMAPPVFFLDKTTQRQVYESVSSLWEVLHLGSWVGGDPVGQAWREGRASDEELAQAYVNWVKAFAYPCYKAGLLQAGREEKDAEAVLQQYFEKLREAALKDPAPAEVPFMSALLRRRVQG